MFQAYLSHAAIYRNWCANIRVLCEKFNRIIMAVVSTDQWPCRRRCASAQSRQRWGWSATLKTIFIQFCWHAKIVLVNFIVCYRNKMFILVIPMLITTADKRTCLSLCRVLMVAYTVIVMLHDMVSTFSRMQYPVGRNSLFCCRRFGVRLSDVERIKSFAWANY